MSLKEELKKLSSLNGVNGASEHVFVTNRADMSDTNVASFKQMLSQWAESADLASLEKFCDLVTACRQLDSSSDRGCSTGGKLFIDIDDRLAGLDFQAETCSHKGKFSPAVVERVISAEDSVQEWQALIDLLYASKGEFDVE